MQIQVGDQYMVLELTLIPTSPAGFRPLGFAAKPEACGVLPQRGFALLAGVLPDIVLRVFGV